MVKVLTSAKALPPFVQSLVDEREKARANKNYPLSDNLRRQIEDMGYILHDSKDGVQVMKEGDYDKVPEKRFLILFGSGEIAPSSVEIYRQTFLELGKKDLRVALITTPAGFQPNVELVYGEIKDFLLASLPDFNLTIDILLANTKEDANDEELVAELDKADVIFLGPGSPTYAVKSLENTLLYNKIIERVKNRSTLILSSAATIAFSRHALPVYEIYKVGEELHWLDGLNIYQEIWEEQSIIPHFNNTEGGAGLDTSYCYIGKNRADQLFSMLPSSTPILGIDEHTAMVINLDNGDQELRGKGTVHHISLE